MGSWQGKVAIVTGGSSGLGLAIARAFAAHGASVVIAARGAEALERVARQLESAGATALAVPTDVTQQDQVERLIIQTIDRFGRIDVLVNNAGRSVRGLVIETTPEQFQQSWELNFLAVVRLTRAAMPYLLPQHGHIVNIGSLAAKSAARWLGPYPATKFPLAAYSQQLRLELGPQGLHVLLVNPGPIAVPASRGEEEFAGLPESARKPGGGVRLKQIDPDWLAERIVTACEQREPELVVPAKAKLLFALSALSARWGDWLIRKST